MVQPRRPTSQLAGRDRPVVERCSIRTSASSRRSVPTRAPRLGPINLKRQEVAAIWSLSRGVVAHEDVVSCSQVVFDRPKVRGPLFVGYIDRLFTLQP